MGQKEKELKHKVEEKKILQREICELEKFVVRRSNELMGVTSQLKDLQ
jgi:hypothetical protein